MSDESFIIVADTSVLINFLRIDRLDLIGRCSRHFLGTDHVRDEITSQYPEQVERYNSGLTNGFIIEINVDSIPELKIYSRLLEGGRLGQGECSAIAVAVHRRYGLAIDDRRAIKEATALDSSLSVFKTQDIMIMIIQEELLTVAEADAILAEWSANHRFRLKIKSFSELIKTV
jgi:predicted nucleic acid-binding protein